MKFVQVQCKHLASALKPPLMLQVKGMQCRVGSMQISSKLVLSKKV